MCHPQAVCVVRIQAGSALQHGGVLHFVMLSHHIASRAFFGALTVRC